jgi:cobalt/nickel transport system permease protein
MHIPDGFIDIPTAVATGAVALGVAGCAVRRTGKSLGERTVPVLGVTAAFIFAAQMLNFPIGPGTSGHFLGALLAAALLGPWAAALTLTVVLLAQALVMADGGITALGANVTNMAVVAVFVGYGLFLLLKRLLPRTPAGYLVSAAVASWFSMVAASAACAVELALSGTIPLGVALPAMVSVHMVIGLGEALITAAVLSAVLVARPDLVASFDLPRESLRQPGATRLSRRSRLSSFVAAGLVMSVALVVFVAPFASGSPDGLESVAQTHASGAAADPVWNLSPLGDYQLPGVQDGRLSTALAGVIGTIALFVLIVGAGRLIGRRGPGRDRAETG